MLISLPPHFGASALRKRRRLGARRRKLFGWGSTGAYEDEGGDAAMLDQMEQEAQAAMASGDAQRLQEIADELDDTAWPPELQQRAWDLVAQIEAQLGT